MNKGRRALAFWGGQVAYRMRTADSVELWVLASGDEFSGASSNLRRPHLADCQGDRYFTAPGLVHARQALISDASFDWEAAAGATKPSWQYAIRFTSAGESSFVLLDLKRLGGRGRRPRTRSQNGYRERTASVPRGADTAPSGSRGSDYPALRFLGDFSGSTAAIPAPASRPNRCAQLAMLSPKTFNPPVNPNTSQTIRITIVCS